MQTLSAKSKGAEIRPTPSGISQAPSGKSSPFALSELARAFPLSWSHYVLLISRTRSLKLSLTTKPRLCAVAGACASSFHRKNFCKIQRHQPEFLAKSCRVR